MLRIRIIGTSASGGTPAFAQTTNNSFPNEVEYLWNENSMTDPLSYVNIKDTSGRREGFTSNAGRDLLVPLPYYTKNDCTL